VPEPDNKEEPVWEDITRANAEMDPLAEIETLAR